MKRISVRELTFAAAVAAVYVILGYFGNAFHLTFGAVQCRFSEALTLLPFLHPAAGWGVFAGCVVTNLLSPYGALDMIFGSLATLLAAALTARCPNKWLAALPPVVCNAVVLGAVMALQTVGTGAAFRAAFCYQAAAIALGQGIACYGLGVPLLTVAEKIMPNLSQKSRPTGE